EIVFAVEAALPWSYLRRNAPVRQRSVMVFSKLRVWDTEHNNGVLIHVDLAERDVEIVADRGIARRVPPQAWQAVCDEMRVEYRAGRFEAGSVAGVSAVGLHLAAHFPRDAAFELDELPDRPSVV
ncbi:MAG TPA: TPM domain-containing protein, partial [Burkholderiaceae bacterium]|nr:TPM domain-containing protein [Burkholderiaceae bacterium]